MPLRQRGFARKRRGAWLAVWREDGRERSRGGFETKTAAHDYANLKAAESVERELALRFHDPLPHATAPIDTVADLVHAFLARHRVDAATTKKLRAQLKHATGAFGDRRLETLQPIELDVWRSGLPVRSAHYVFRAFRQALEYAVAMGLLDANPTARIRNVRASVTPARSFRSSRGSGSKRSARSSTRGTRRSAGQAALHLARYARRVTLLVRAASLDAGMSHYLVQTVEAAPNVDVRTGTTVVGGGGEGYLRELVLRDAAGDETTVGADALFVLIGARPETGWLPPELSRDEYGFLLTGDDVPAEDWPLERSPLSLETSMPGVLAAGDVRHGSVKRVAAAVGEGSIAIQLVQRLAADGRLRPAAEAARA
jgi:hypothetical protein